MGTVPRSHGDGSKGPLLSDNSSQGGKDMEAAEPPMHAQKSSEPSKMTVAFAISLYAACSSCMLVVNKVAVTVVPAPAFLLFCQLGTAAVVVFAAASAGVVESNKLEWEKVKAFVFVVFAFVGAVFTNMKTLQYSNVETFIVFRSSTPLIISIFDYFFLGRQLPCTRSWISLLGLLFGSVMYVTYDSAFDVRAYVWVAFWYAVFTFDQVYIKYVCDTVAMTSWGRVYYTNLLSCLPVLILAFAFQETDIVLGKTGQFSWDSWAIGALALSCVVGIAMSYSAFLLRAMVSATSFTVVGILCKIATVIINCTIWDKHASGMGLTALAICLAAGSFYKQAPYRDDRTSK